MVSMLGDNFQQSAFGLAETLYEQSAKALGYIRPSALVPNSTIEPLMAGYSSSDLYGTMASSLSGMRAMAASLLLLSGSFINAQSSTISGLMSATESAHALFTIPASADVGQPILPNVLDPEAVDAQTVCPGYTASGVNRDQYGFTASLTMAGKACNVYGTDVDYLNLTVQYQSDDRLNVMIVPTYLDSTNMSHYILPTSLVNKAGLDSDANETVPMNDLDFVWSNEPSFWFSVIRKSMGESLFSTKGSKLVFENQFIELKTQMPQEYNVYGLGEVIHGLRLGNNLTRTLWNSDNGDTVDKNIYGTHPVYYETRYYEVDPTTGQMNYVPWNSSSEDAEYVSQTHGVYLRNAHGHEVLMRNDTLTWRTIGGSIDLYFYSGPTVEQVAKSYQLSNIGLPAMQQYFTFGYHQCRWGYTNWSVVEGVVNSMEQFQIPLETMWTDIDYMGAFRDFTTDNISFPLSAGNEFLTRLHQSGRHYVPITDSAIYIPNPQNKSDAYPVFNRGNDSDAFMTNPDGSLYIGAVWPGYTVFPDWLSSGAGNWWSGEIKHFHDQLPFDGLWIDMSEVSSFCIGSCGTGNVTLNPAPGGISTTPICNYPEGFELTNATEAASASSCLSSQSATSTSTSAASTSYLRTRPTAGVRNINYPPYAINAIYPDIAQHGASPNSTHRDELKTSDYDVHNLWGYGILNATYYALANTFPGKRPFIIGRSQFAGAGHVAGHWGGDNTSTWWYMFFSIPQALSMSLFGIPMFGVDTCGFNGNTDEELCTRWIQLSAFFPFYRNHNTIGAISQEPYRWASVAAAAKTAMDIRYSMIPYIYTLFYQAHTTGSTVMRALAWEFPGQPNLANTDTQFLLGPSVMVAPVLGQGETEKGVVFPGVKAGSVWYDWYNSSAITSSEALSGQNVTVPAPLGHIPVYIRGGSVLPLQPPAGALVLRDARQKPWSLLVALDKQETASGQLYLDDGESIVPASTLWVDLTATNNTLYASGRGAYEDKNPLSNITIMGVQKSVSDVKLNGEAVKTFDYDTVAKRLSVTGLEGMTSSGAWLQDWQLNWE